MNRAWLLFLLLIFFGQLAAQPLAEQAFARYTTADGLSQDAVTGLAQDATGYVWIATAAGLNRYDGSHFVQFHSNDDSASLAAEEMTVMTWLDAERLGMYTAAGLHVVDTRTGKTRNLFVPYRKKQYQYKFNTIHGAKADADGNLFILTRSGFYHFKNYNLVSRFDYYSEEDLDHTHFHFGGTLHQLDHRRLLIVSSVGLYLYDKEEKQTRKLQPQDCPVLALFTGSTDVRQYLFLQQKPGHFFVFKSDSDSLYYINTIENRQVISRLPFKARLSEFHWRSRLVSISDTLLYITSHSSGFYKMRFNPRSGVATLDPEKQFAAFLCTSLLKDKDGQLWIGTNRGLFRQEPRKTQVQFTAIPPGIADSFPNIRLCGVYAGAGTVYVGARGGAGLLLFDKKSLRFEGQILFDKKLTGLNQIYAMTPAGATTLLLGTNGVPLLFDVRSKKARRLLPPNWDMGDWTNDLQRDQNGQVWLSSSSAVYQYNPGTQQFFQIPMQVRSLTLPVFITEDAGGHMWMASHGLARYNKTAERFDLFIDSFPFIKMPDRQVNAFLLDAQHTVWFNSHNNGLIGYDLNRRTFRHFTTRNGLPDNNIVALQRIGNQLWMACYSGVACIDLTTSQISSFGKDDGFPNMPIEGGARFFYDSVARQLYLSFSNAIARFYPDQLLQKKAPPRLFIESLTIGNQKPLFLPADTVNTSWKDNSIHITIGTINFSDAGNQRFAYRIAKESATPWTQLGMQPSVSISSLLPGTHRIQVKVYSGNNRWPEQVRSINILVLPPLWLEDWFLTLSGIMALVFLYLFIKWRTQQARRKEMEQTHIEKLKADYYKNQYELEQITNYFSSSLAGKKTTEEVLWDVAKNLIGRMQYEDCVIYLWNDKKTRMIQKAAYGPKGIPEIIWESAFEVEPGQGIVGHVMQTRQPLLVPDTRMESRYRVDDAFRLSEITVPILHNDELLGVIDSEHSQAGYYTEQDIKILTTIATLLGNKLKQIESEQSLEAKQKELVSINEQLAEARLSALQAQMNPHFVFNALNSIKRMILDGDNEMASRYLSKFALMIRLTLEHSKDVFVTLDENIGYMKAYLEMEQLRFGDSFTYSIHTDETIDTDEVLIPSLMIQPLVENAIWHGLLQADTEKKLQVDFRLVESKIVCTVEDNGIGFHRSEALRQKQRPLHRSMGLQNLHKRIGIINEKYNTGCSLAIIDVSDSNRSGTKAVLQLNLITTYQNT